MVGEWGGSTPFLSSPLFRGLSQDQVTSILEMFERRTYPPDTMIVREGEPGDALFVVESGLVEVILLSARGDVTVLTRLGPGETFGEMAVLTGETRSAGIRTVSQTTVRMVERVPFLRAAGETPMLLFNLSRVLAARLEETSRAANKHRGPKVVAIIGRLPPVVGSLVATNIAAALSWTTRERVMLIDRPAEQASKLPGREDSPALSSIWSSSGKRIRVPAHRFGAARFMAASLPPDGGLLQAIQPLSLGEALTWFRQNARYTVINLVGEERANVEAILPHMDRNYLLITTAQLSTPFADEIVSAFSAQRADVREHSFPVLLSDEGLSLSAVRARSTERLGVPARSIIPGLAQLMRDAADHPPPLAIEARHISFSRAMHWLARDIAGLKVGVVLGSGGARGFAHVGAFKFLEENDIPNDYLSGCSMGSVIAAPRALGMDVAQGLETMLRFHHKFTSLLRPTWSLMSSILNPKGVEDGLRELVGDATFEELPVPFAVVAADLETARPIVFTEGLLADALRASSAIPLVFPPKVIGKLRLVDGAVLNPVPTQAVRDLGADVVIAVDLSGRKDDMAEVPAAGRLPNIFQNAMRCIDIMTAERAVRDCLLADVVIRPKFVQTGWKHFDQADAYSDAGYEAAQEALPALQKLLPWLNRD